MTAINFLLVVILGATCFWLAGRLPEKKAPAAKAPAPRVPCSVKDTMEYLGQLKQIAQQEKWKSENLRGMVAKRAAWIAAKAEFATFRGKDPKAIQDPKVRNLIEDTYLMVIRSRHQNDQGAATIQEENGARLRTYRSPVDDTVQTYSVFVPKIYDPSIKWPLLVSMHGHGWYRPFQGHPAPAYGGIITLSPQGRGATDYKDLGEDDVLMAIEHVKKEFNIDPDRIYLTGSSMGGTGAYHLGVHYADRFAAIFPIVGNADNLAWTERWGWNRLFPGRNDKLRNFVQEGHTARAFAENLRNLPAYILAGAADTVVPPAHSRNVVNELRRLNINHQYREYPGVGHGGFPASATQEGLAWTCSWKRNRYPKQVTWKTDLLKHGRAYWTRIDQLERPMRSGTIRAYVNAPDYLTVTTENLQAFSIQKPQELFSPGTVTVTVDGTHLKLHDVTDLSVSPETWYTFRKHPGTGQWMREQDVEVQPLAKRAGCEGPVHEAFMAPFALVIGTTNETMTPVWKQEARHVAEDWKFKNNDYPRILLDTEVTDEIAQKYNLILFGGSSDNLISSQVIAQTPIEDLQKLVKSEYKEQKTLFDQPDVGSIIVYPNVPMAPDKLVVLIHANGPEAAYQLWGRFGNWFNWGVFDSKKYFDFAVFDKFTSSPETMLLVGWFGTNWAVQKDAYFFRNQDVMKNSAPQHYPHYDQNSEDLPDTLMLYDLKPTRITQMRGAIGLGRTFFGEPLPQSIGMRAPATMEYSIKGQYKTLTTEVTLLNPRESNMCKQRLDAETIRFAVYGDGKLLKDLKVNWKAPKGTIKVAVDQVKVLKLVAEPAGGPAWLHMGSAWLKPTLQR